MTFSKNSTLNNLLPKVSIITPSYNQGDFLEETILSVLNQTYPNIEYILVDGGSDDNSIEIISKYEKDLAHWISEPDFGQGDAINKGYHLSQGDFVTWLNSDDILYKYAIENMIMAILENPDPDIGLFYGNVKCGYTEEGASLRYGRQTSFGEMLKSFKVPIPQQGSIFRREILSKVGFLDPKWHYVLDRELFLRISNCSKIKYIPELLGFFRLHKSSKSVNRKFSVNWCSEMSSLYEDIMENWNLSCEGQNLSRQEILSLVYLSCAFRGLRSVSLKLFLKFIVKASISYSASFLEDF